MKTEQQVIQEAYGEYWELFSTEEQDLILKNKGWVSKFNHPLHWEMEKFYEIETLAYGVGTSWRPKSLQGIENNNGWIKIESEEQYDKLENGSYHWYNIEKDVYDDGDLMSYGVFTHYQPIEKPKPPIH